jgi:hypothetical protein
MELKRLDELHRVFHKHAVETQDPASGMLCVKNQRQSDRPIARDRAVEARVRDPDKLN